MADARQAGLRAWRPRDGALGRTLTRGTTWPTIRKCNPLTAVNPRLRRTLHPRERRSPARRPAPGSLPLAPAEPADPDGWPRADTASPVGRRSWNGPVPPREGQPVLGLDLGAARRSWSCGGAVVAQRPVPRSTRASPVSLISTYRNGPLGLAVGCSARWWTGASVAVAEGKRVADIDVLLDRLPAVDVQGVVADRILSLVRWVTRSRRSRYPPCRVARLGSGAAATEDLASFRRYCLRRAVLSVAHECRALATLGMARSRGRAGHQRQRTPAQARSGGKRDDVAAALLLAGGAVRRWPVAAPLGFAAL